jgi:diguanylate cyclase (GGDEF)-like protein
MLPFHPGEVSQTVKLALVPIKSIRSYLYSVRPALSSKEIASMQHKPRKVPVLTLLLIVPVAILLAIGGLYSSFPLQNVASFISLGISFSLVCYLSIAVRQRKADSMVHPTTDDTASLKQLCDLHTRTIEALAMAIDAKDQTSQGHVRRTQLYATSLGKLLNVSVDEMHALFSGAILHDIGKLAVPENILNKPGKLTVAEFARMKVHPTVGGDILRRVDFPYPVEEIVRFHHEKWDGTGYPSGLKGETIPKCARIISVVDFYDTTRCDRPYRKGMTQSASLDLLQKMAGSSFDPEIVRTFIDHVREFDTALSVQDLSEQVPDSATPSVPESNPDGPLRDPGSHNAGEMLGLEAISSAQREVFALHEIAQVACTSLDLEDTLSLITRKLHPIVPFDTCAVYLVDRRSGKAVVTHVCGEGADALQHRQIAVGEGITGWVISNGRSMASSSPELDLIGLPENTLGRVQNLLSAPLVNDSISFGALTLYSQSIREYNGEQIRLLEAIARVCSSAVNNALTFEKTRKSALTDGLTDLPNVRAFYMILEQRLAECQRVKHQSLAVLSMDIDEFRKINDLYGHVTGDRVLGDIASVIKQELRQMDALARYAGDQFVAIMPLASSAAAVAAVERIRFAVESSLLWVKTGETAAVRLSMGVSCFPDDGETADDLLSTAMERMRQNKIFRRSMHIPTLQPTTSLSR